MCRCCQSIFESLYWHCFAKWKFDEDIALYEDETAEKKISRQPSQNDNMAFWDSVSTIANKSAIIMQPSASRLSLYQSDEPITFTCRSQEQKNQINIEPNQKSLQPEILNPNLTDAEKCNIINNRTEEELINNNKKYRKKSTIEDIISKKNQPPEEKQRKKSLKERRNSTANLTLDLSFKLNDFHEVPIIRQDSVPKFYIDYTPDYNPFVESNVLTSPIVSHTGPNFDLKSVVQLEKEIEHEQAMHTENVKRLSTKQRVANIKRKMAPMLVKRSSVKNLPDSVNHI